MEGPNPNPPFPVQNSPAGDIRASISALRELADTAESTLKSISEFISLPSTSTSAANGCLSCCPFDRHHWMPPESLFCHSLLCPSAPGAPILDLGFVDTLRYPTSLKSDAQLRQENSSVQPLPDPGADFCFSLDSDLGDAGLGFFYRDCPGVVTTPEPDAAARTFTLPGLLSTECANFVFSHGNEGSIDFAGSGIQILPSDYWALRCEVEEWSEFPVSYSYAVLLFFSSLDLVKEGGLKKWVISNSPQFGILIDVAMREHICLLLKLCLKAITREAHTSLMLVLRKDDLLDTKSLTFWCPKLVESLTWLASQLSVLYGEVNGKSFTIGMLKEALLQAGASMLLSGSLGDKFEDGNINGAFHGDKNYEAGGSKLAEDSKVENASQDASRGQVFVSQVAAAVAALRERSMLEKRIKAIRFAPPLSKSQLILEHRYASARGWEERGKRPNYRPVLEHDGFLWHRAQNQDLGKAKTREELLAEERDYKRRRMSYRGKKVKRNPVEVIRDIIEEHMEEIKQAGGIGCGVSLATGKPISPVKCEPQNDENSDLDKLQRNDFDLFETRKRSSFNKVLQDGDGLQSGRSSMSTNILKSHEKMSYGFYKPREDHNSDRHERHKNYGSSFPLHRSAKHSHDRYASEREQGDVAHGPKYDRSNFSYSPRSMDLSRSSSKSSRREHEYVSGNRSKERSRYYESRRSEPVFEDRYEPSGSDNGYDARYGYVPKGSTDNRSDKFYEPSSDDKYNDEHRRDDCSTRWHYKDHQ